MGLVIQAQELSAGPFALQREGYEDVVGSMASP